MALRCSLCLLGLLLLGTSSQLTPDCSATVYSIDDLFMVSASGPDFLVCVELSEPQILDYTDTIIANTSVWMRPFNTSRSSVLVTCNNTKSLPLSEYSDFPLTFGASESVTIENIDFTSCQRPVRMNWVKNIRIINTTFSNFSPGGALEISNSPHVSVEGSTFTNNTSEGIGKSRYSGNSGGLSIGYDQTPRPPSFEGLPPRITILGSRFINNTANASGVFKYSVSEVLKMALFNQRGGGVAIYIGTRNYSAEIEISDSLVEANWAADSGGGVYMNIGGDGNSHTVTIHNVRFDANYGPDGGGLEITQYSDISPHGPHHNVTITDSVFTANTGVFGGGFKSIQVFTYLNSVNLYNCSFTHNTAAVGAALYMQSIYSVTVSTVLEESIIEDCLFESNIGNRGTLFIIQNSVGIRGSTLFLNNTGPALRVLHSLVSLGGDISFIGNNAHSEGFSGALYFSQYGQAVLKRGVSITFINNTGSEGACIVVRGQLIASSFPRQLYNPQCFLQYEDAILPTQDWEVDMYFEGNKAQLGPIVYASDLSPCQWFNEVEPFFAINSTEVWAFMELGDNYIAREYSEISPADYVQTEIHSLDIMIPNATIAAPPGSLVELDAIALDQSGRRTSAFLELLNDEDKEDNVVFEPSIAQVPAGNTRIAFTYNSPKTKGKTDVILRASFISSENIPSAMFELTHELCLPGYAIVGDRCQCQEGSETVLFCLPEERGILLADGLWGAPPTWSRDLVTYRCPPGYCSCNRDSQFQEREGCPLIYDEPYQICQGNRTGLLCGSCGPGEGVGLLTNICREYYDPIPQAIWLLPIYLILLVIILVVLVRLGVHLPTLLRGFLFYTQLSSLSVAFLPQTLNFYTEVMDCFWSATSLYIPYDFSFHRNLTSLESFGLNYIPLLVAIATVPLAAWVGHSHSKYWHGVWTIVMLMYSRIVATSVALLYCPTLTGRLAFGEPDTITLWFFDGNVKCFQGAHIFLGLLAIIVLLLTAALVPLTALVIYHRKLKHRILPAEKVEALSIAMTTGFRKGYHWWPVLELGCRFVFVSLVLLTPGYTVVPLVLALLLLATQALAQPYSSVWANNAETAVLFWLVGILALGNTTPIVIASQDPSNTSFTLWPLFFFPFVVGCLVAITHTVHTLWNWYMNRKRPQGKSDTSTKEISIKSLAASLAPRKLHSVKPPNMASTERRVSSTVVDIDEFEMVNNPDSEDEQFTIN